MPPPQPVPIITPNTEPAPLALPSVASDNAKQLASLAKVTGRLSFICKSPCKSSPIRQVELAFFIRPVLVDIAPGMPIPTRPGKLMFGLSIHSFSASFIKVTMALTVSA